MRALPRGFTLIELLVVVAIISLLATLVIVSWPSVKIASQRTAALANLRAVGIAARLYTSDHDGKMPARVVSTDKWPALLADYLDDVRVYAATGDTNNYIFQKKDPLSNGNNNTSYIMNGFNDVGAYNDETIEVKIVQINNPGKVILFATPKERNTHFYMDFEGGGGGDHVTALDLERYGEGSNYLFADGSAQFIKKEDYDPRMWLVNPDYQVP